MHSLVDLARAAASCRARATLGDCSEAPALLRALRAEPAPLAAAWELALRAQIWLAFPEAVTLPAVSELAPFAAEAEPVRRVAAFAARDVARASLLAMDAPAVQRATDELGRLACDEHGAIDAAVAGALRALLCGEPLARDVEQLGTRAGKAGHAAAVVEAQAIRALVALESADWAAGLELARRSSLMARTESIPEAEFFANLVLARARRENRQAHVALRIVDALSALVTAPWQNWIGWEAALLGGDVPPVADGPAAWLAELLRAARHGDGTAFHARWQPLRGRVGAGLFGRELDDVVATLAPDLPAPRSEIAAWRRGDADFPRPALQALASHAGGDGDGELAAAYVLLRPGQAGVRLLQPGLALVAGPDVERLPHGRRAPGRLEMLLAVLALAGPDGVDEPSCFARCYGFPYVQAIHGGVLDVLVHRARAAVQGAGRVERRDGRLALVATHAMVIPDPRTTRQMTDRVLRLLAQQGRASAKEAALKLRVSLRAVQGALNELARTEACVVARNGRQITYAVEDTVFSKPTLRFRAAGLGAVGIAARPAADVVAGQEKQDVHS
jgi:hypothetical protein